jgi:DedD protein
MPTREAELFKDKIEVSLDGRQIFYLFFGGAVIVGMVFVLGVMVGRRVEARGHLDHAATPASADPLAALDRLEGSGGLSFHGTLLGNDKERPVEKAIADIEKQRAEAPAAVPAVAPAPVPVAAPQKANDAQIQKQIDKHDEKKDDKKKGDKKHADADAAGTFTLQISSFQDKGEAQALLEQIRTSGYQAYLTSAEVDGKGTFYRVRVGKFASMDAATDAKAEFEKTAKRSALVTRL